MLLTALFVTSMASAMEHNLLDTARSEASTSLAETVDKKDAKKRTAEVAPAIDRTQISMLRLEDRYQTPRWRNYDFRADLTLETLRISGDAPNRNLGVYNVDRAGDVPLATLRFGFLAPVMQSRLSAGLAAFGGYGLQQYDQQTPNGASVKSRLNAVTYGASAQARWGWTSKLFSELSYEQGQFNWRQSSPDTTLAQWSEDAKSDAARLGLGYNFAQNWEIAGGLMQRRLQNSRFDLSSSQWSVSTGVKW